MKYIPKRQQNRSMKLRAGLLEKINKIDEPLARLTKREDSNKYRNKREVTITDTTQILQIIRDYYK